MGFLRQKNPRFKKIVEVSISRRKHFSKSPKHSKDGKEFCGGTAS